MFVPTSHACPVHHADSDARPGGHRVVDEVRIVQSGSPGSRQYASPLKPAQAKSRVGEAAMLSMFEA
jgi:hypothetical protein